MLMLSQAPPAPAPLTARSITTARTACNSSFSSFSKGKAPFVSKTSDRSCSFPMRKKTRPVTLANAAVTEGDNGASSSSSSSSSAVSAGEGADNTVFVGADEVPLEGVIQVDRSGESSSSSSKVKKWGRVAVLAGGDAFFLFLFAAVGRYSHGFPVFHVDTLRTVDPFLAGWFLSAYFLGGYADDGRGANGRRNAIVAAAKSWAVGIPLGVVIRTITLGHIPPSSFILVTMGSTGVFLIGWRAVLNTILPFQQAKVNDVYKRGSPFELFELLTSLIRRW